MPESQSDDESDSSVVESDDSDDEKESVNESIQSDSDEEMGSNSEKLTCHHCEKGHAHIVYLLACPRCSWRDFYWDKDDHCTICKHCKYFRGYKNYVPRPHVTVFNSFLRVHTYPCKFKNANETRPEHVLEKRRARKKPARILFFL